MPQKHKHVNYVEAEEGGEVVTGLHKDIVPHNHVLVPIPVHLEVHYQEQPAIHPVVMVPLLLVHVLGIVPLEVHYQVQYVIRKVVMGHLVLVPTHVPLVVHWAAPLVHFPLAHLRIIHVHLEVP